MSSYTSSRGSSPSTSPTRAMSIASQGCSAHRGSFSAGTTPTTSTLATPYTSCMGFESRRWSDRPSAYISDADLFGDDDEHYLSEPPPPPRQAEAWLARPLLPPVVNIKPRSCRTEPKKKRRSSSSVSTKD